MTPNELAKELGISPKKLRNWLRVKYERPPELKYKHWRIPQVAIDEARRKTWAT